LEEIEKFSGKLGPLLSLALTGGEPFMREDLAEVCKVFYKNNNARAVNISTNGFFSQKIESDTKEILQNCKKMILSVELSIDDLGEAHDQARGLPNSFERLSDTYSRLSELRKKHPNLWLKANTAFCAYNQDRMLEIQRAIREKFNFDDHSITLISGDPRDPAAKANVSMEKYEESIQTYDKERAAKKKTMIERLFSVLRAEVLEEILRGVRERKPRFNCKAIKKIVFIDETGDVYPCSMIREKLGSLREHYYDIREVLRSPRTKEIVKKYGIYSGCYCCWDCGVFNNIVYDPGSYPRIIKRWVRGR